MSRFSFFRPRIFGCLLAIFALLSTDATLRAQATALITTRVDETKLVQLTGNVSPKLKGALDLGEADKTQPAGRMLLVLKRSDEKEEALQDFLQSAHQQSSSAFHAWLKPGEFGKQYGTADADIAQLTGWLQSHGMHVAGASGGKNMIEFTGTVGQVDETFHTSIHKYTVQGETHYANISNPQIPEALAQVVAGVTQLTDFKPTPMVKKMGQAKFDPKKHTGVPQWTVPLGTGLPSIYFLTPEDFSTQYDAKPAYAAGVTGAGQTIGIINDSNIDLSLVNAYRKLFGLPVNAPQIVIDGNDPGIVDGDDIEAYLDVENAGAVAPGATIKLYIAGDFGLLGDGGLTFSIVRAVTDAAAPILSLSFGNCENGGSANNVFVNSIWEQAAAQGQTVLVSAGDSGSAGCYGLDVNGLASSPWDVAVGGTDAYFSDYATGGASISTFWSNTNDANLGSLQHKFTEQVWNGSQYGLNSTLYDPDPTSNDGAGGGGASSCAVGGDTFDNHNFPICISGYPKPSWQVGVGVPNDKVRDLPDVSLFASDADNGVIWPICAVANDCSLADPTTGNTFVTGVGGTSASAPAMAGIMALVNQKYGPQGQANFTLYPLAQQFPVVFNDIILGSNNEFCGVAYVGYLVGCALDPGNSQSASLRNYYATPGYDLASGLGSVDINQLITNWGSITFKPSVTTLSMTPATITHGHNVAALVSVTGTGTPSGVVSLVTTSTLPGNKSIAAIELDKTGSGQEFINYFPGGTYTVTAQYSGDGINAASKSQPVTLTVAPEASTLTLNLSAYTTTQGTFPVVNGSQLVYGSIMVFDVLITGATGATDHDGLPTGTVTFMNGTTVLGTSSVNIGGGAEFNATALPAGSYSITAVYSGDASYKTSTAGPVTFTIGKDQTFMQELSDSTIGSGSPNFYFYGESANLTGMVTSLTGIAGLVPTGTITFQLANIDPQTFQPSTLVGSPITVPLTARQNLLGSFYDGSAASAFFTNLQAPPLFPGAPLSVLDVTITYGGDANFTGSVINSTLVLGMPYTSATLNSTTTYTITNPANLANISPSTTITFAATVTGVGNVAPTGAVVLTVGNLLAAASGPVKLTPGSGNTSTATFSLLTSFLEPGPNSVSVVYTGDSVYLPSSSTTTIITNDNTDFSVQTLTPNLAVTGGATGSANISLSSINGFNGTVALSCTISAGLTCTAASAKVALNGNATVAVNIVAAVTKAELIIPPTGWSRTATGAVLACTLLFILPRRRRFLRGIACLLAGVVVLGSVGCGHSGSSTSGPTGPVTTNASPGVYTAVVTATGSNGVIHNTTITVIVQ